MHAEQANGRFGGGSLPSPLPHLCSDGLWEVVLNNLNANGTCSHQSVECPLTPSQNYRVGREIGELLFKRSNQELVLHFASAKRILESQPSSRVSIPSRVRFGIAFDKVQYVPRRSRHRAA